MHKELCILGSGPGGLRAAFEGARLGFAVTLVERGLLGGTCLNCGCIPTKQYLNGTASLALLKSAKAQKAAAGEATASLSALKAKKDRYIKGTRQAVEKQLREAGIRLIYGEGRIKAQWKLEVTQADGGVEECSWDKLILATGSHPASFPGVAADHACVLDSTDILELEEAPESLIVVGAGAIGLEMADFYSRLGTKITLVEAFDRLAPSEDSEIGETLRRTYAREGWDIHTGKAVAELISSEGKAVLRFADGAVLFAAKALLAAGRRPNAAVPGLELLGVKSGRLSVDECLRIAPHVYAVGDVNGKSLLAHAAEHQAGYAVAHAVGQTTSAYAPPPMPACIYGHMEVMRVGPAPQDLTKRPNIGVSRSNLIANAIAQGYCTTQGFVKVFWENGRVVGICAVGHGVSHLVSLAAVIVSQGWRAEDADQIIWAHPTLDEALHAALTAPREALGQE